MAGKVNSKLARNANREMSATEHGKRQRRRMTAEWALVLDMLTGEAPRKTKDGRNITQVWADMVLADPPGEFARVAQYLLPPEAPEAGQAGNVTNVQALYLMAVQAANRDARPEITETIEGANGVQPKLTDW
jgi:hypothetical protein